MIWYDSKRIISLFNQPKKMEYLKLLKDTPFVTKFSLYETKIHFSIKHGDFKNHHVFVVIDYSTTSLVVAKFPAASRNCAIYIPAGISFLCTVT